MGAPLGSRRAKGGHKERRKKLGIRDFTFVTQKLGRKREKGGGKVLPTIVVLISECRGKVPYSYSTDVKGGKKDTGGCGYKKPGEKKTNTTPTKRKSTLIATPGKELKDAPGKKKKEPLSPRKKKRKRKNPSYHS